MGHNWDVGRWGAGARKAGALMVKEEDGVVASYDGEEGAGGAKQPGTLLGARLRRGLSIAQRGGPCTPAPPWRLEEDVAEAGPSRAHDNAVTDADGGYNRARPKQHHRHRSFISFPAAAAAAAGAGAAASARKLGANLWEVQDSLQHSRMSRRGTRSRHRREEMLPDLSDLSILGPHEQPQSAGSLRRHVAASLIQHYKSADRNAHALQPVSPACYSSSMEVAAYNQAVTPASSLDLKGKAGCSLRTSTELLKVLNRIWSLEEQHASNISLVKSLKFELEHAKAHIQELLQEKMLDRRELDDLMVQISEHKLATKNKEQERIKAAVQSIRDELEEERRLKRHSESLHRRLAKELSEVKSAFSRTLKDLEREKKAHKSLQCLCDEFAMGVREYEHEVRELKQKSEKVCDRRCDRLILHISEAWLDERLQMKLAEDRGDLFEKNEIMDRLACEVETFLKARQSNNLIDEVLNLKDTMDCCSHRHSLESVHLNGAVSAPQDVEDGESLASDLHSSKLKVGTNATERHDGFKFNGGVERLEVRKSTATWNMVKSERLNCQHSSRSQIKFKPHAHSCNKSGIKFINRVQGIHTRNISEGGKDANEMDVLLPQTSEINSKTQEDLQCVKVKRDCVHRSRHVINNSVSESGTGQIYNDQPEDEHREDLCDALSWRQQSLTVGQHAASGDYFPLSGPEQQLCSHHTSTDLGISECSSELPEGKKENTLKARLLEARLEVQHARLKTSRGTSVGV